ARIRQVQAQTKRIYSVLIARHERRTVARAAELITAGAIGRVIQTTALAPHRMSPNSRPRWFFNREQSGGILCDLASHSIDEFLFFTRSTQAAVVTAQAGNVNHPQFPGLDDFGDIVLRGNGGTGYVRVDWFTPDGLSVFGDGRLVILGTDGYIELRHYVDVGGRVGGDHLFLVDQKQTRHISCSDVTLSWPERFVADVLNRTETSNPQAQTFLAMQVALEAQKAARRLPDFTRDEKH
ncbi:MAG TPA: Gfo/Idh/MocA family oxidoreductase, partial [Vicinamibacterales bacterium]|nr:Gfo/Idh/MocA family oxidoreductase [Vicinamibacterales bacterium]